MSNKASDWLAAIACVAAGTLISTLPHLLAWARTGRPFYVATVDERHYLAVASQAYFNHPTTLADPVRAGGGANIYRSLSFLPGVWAAKLLGLGPLGIGPTWRVIAGTTIGLGWYVLFRQKLSRPWVAAALAVILLSDPGLVHGFPLIRLVNRAIKIALAPSHSFFPGGQWIYLGWRVVNPAMTMPYLMAFIWAVTRARASPTHCRIVVAGLVFGLLFYVYFYYWTAAGLALVLAMALDAGHRRVYFHSGWIGGLLGLPAVVSDFLLKQRLPSVTESLLRQERFMPIGRFDELVLPPEMVVAVALGLTWVLIRRLDLIFVWSLGMAGLLLANNQVITRLQIENYHWQYVWGPVFEFLFLLIAAEELGERLGWSPIARRALLAISLGVFGVGLWIRKVESTRCIEPVTNIRVVAAYRAELPADRTRRFAPNAVAAGDADFVDFAAILDNLRPLDGWVVFVSPSVSDAEFDDRAALNDLLLGVERAAFEDRQHAFYTRPYPRVGPWYHDPSLIPGRVAARLAAYDRARADLTGALDRFAVRYVGLPAGKRPAYLASGWAPVAIGPTWDVWERLGSSQP